MIVQNIKQVWLANASGHRPNSELEDLLASQSRIQREIYLADQSLAGAIFATEFIKNTLLKSFKIKITQGRASGKYHAILLEAFDVDDNEATCDVDLHEFENDFLEILYEGFSRGIHKPVPISCERSAIEHLLVKSENVDGADAFKAFFPEVFFL